MTQIVENRSLPDSFPAGHMQECHDRSKAETPAESGTASTEDAFPFVSPPPVPWPRIFPGL